MQAVTYESRDQIAIITLNRPENGNLLNNAVVDGLHAALKRLNDSDDRAGILAAAGDDFTRGADLGDFPPNIARCVPGVEVPSLKPLVAATQGWTVGLAILIVQVCDLCVAADSTRFLYPEAKLGLTAGMVAGLASRIPHKVAMELMIVGGQIDAQRAYEVGFVNRVVPHGQQLEHALRYAQALAVNAPLVITRLRDLVQAVVPESPTLTAHRERLRTEAVLNSTDAKEGPLAFREKRRPRFQGK